MRIGNAEFEGSRALSIGYEALGPGQVAAATTPTFSPRDVLNMRTYDLMATPLVYPGQVVRARVVAPAGNAGAIEVSLASVYDVQDAAARRRWPDGHAEARRRHGDRVDAARVRRPADRRDRLCHHGNRQASDGDCSSTTCAGTVHLADPEAPGRRERFLAARLGERRRLLLEALPPSFRISQNRGEGLIAHGTREWTDYEVSTELVVHLGNHGGVGRHVQGLRRYYGVRSPGRVCCRSCAFAMMTCSSSPRLRSRWSSRSR